jgi:hypothetical protein
MAFAMRNKLLLTGTSVGLAGAAVGVARGSADSVGEDSSERATTIAHHTAGAGLLAGGAGAAGYAGRSMLRTRGASAAKRFGSWYGKGWNGAFAEKSVGAMFAHGPVGLTIGGIVGGALAGTFGDGPSSVVTGVGVGVVAGVAAYPVARQMSADWKALGKVTKTGVLAAAAVGVGLAARAYLHQPEVELDDTASRDGLGGYDAAPSGLRNRLAAMNGTGDIVLGLHNRR